MKICVSTTLKRKRQALYEKCMKDGRGGYCMETSIFFYHVLRGLGFETYMAGVRIRPRVGGVPQVDYLRWYKVLSPIGSQFRL